MENFEGLTAGLEFPVPLPRETTTALGERLLEYSAELNAAGMSRFHNFFRVAAVVSLVAVVPALPMRGDRGR